MMSLYYEGSDGTIINFMDDGVYAQDPETLLDSEWSYNTISGVNGIGKVKSFYKDTQESSLTLDIMMDDKKSFDERMYLMHKTFEKDIRKIQPGKLWWNDFYKEVFAVETSHDDFDEVFESVSKTIKFISVYPFWVKKDSYQYLSLSGAEGTLDYGMDGFYAGYDLGMDYDKSEYIEIVKNDCIDSANFEITFYGPTEDPTVTIGDHEYEVNTTLSAGEYIKVNSITKTVRKYSNDGTMENIFYLRNKDSYIFEKIPEGLISLSRSRELAVDISIYDERGEPAWI